MYGMQPEFQCLLLRLATSPLVGCSDFSPRLFGRCCGFVVEDKHQAEVEIGQSDESEWETDVEGSSGGDDDDAE